MRRPSLVKIDRDNKKKFLQFIKDENADIYIP